MFGRADPVGCSFCSFLVSRLSPVTDECRRTSMSGLFISHEGPPERLYDFCLRWAWWSSYCCVKGCVLVDLDLAMLVVGWGDGDEASTGWEEGDDVDEPGVVGFMYEY